MTLMCESLAIGRGPLVCSVDHVFVRNSKMCVSFRCLVPSCPPKSFERTYVEKNVRNWAIFPDRNYSFQVILPTLSYLFGAQQLWLCNELWAVYLKEREEPMNPREN